MQCNANECTREEGASFQGKEKHFPFKVQNFNQVSFPFRQLASPRLQAVACIGWVSRKLPSPSCGALKPLSSVFRRGANCTAAFGQAAPHSTPGRNI
jgi:hypothetical protein